MLDIVQPPAAGTLSAPSPVLPVRPTTSVRLDTVQQRLYAVVQNNADGRGAFAEFSLVAAVLTNAMCAVFFQRDASGSLKPGPHFSAGRPPNDPLLKEALPKIEEAARRGSPTIARTADGAAVISVPVARPEGQPGDSDAAAPRDVLAVLLLLGDGDVEPFVVSLQMIAAYATQWYERQIRKQLDWEAQAGAILVELVGAIENSRDQKAACFTLAESLKRSLGCQRVTVGLKRKSGRIALKAISDVAQFASRGETARLYEAALDEAVVRDALTTWPAALDDRHATLAHRKLAEAAQSECIVTTPLRTIDGDLIGAVTVTCGQRGRTRDETVRLLEAAGRYLGNALHLVHRARGGVLTRLGRSLAKDRGWRLKLTAAAAVVVAAVLAVPLPHKIKCPCRLEPLTRRYAVAPYNGLLQQSHVKPGDIVTSDQPLARMDDRELQWELSGLLADRDRAAKQRDASLSQRDIPAAQMAQLEVERLELKVRLVEHRRASLEIRSSIDGMVLDGDLEDATGAPVEMGQPLFEIAPLDRLRLEVAVPDEDLPFVAPGMDVTVTLEGSPYEPLEGRIDCVRPQAELRDDENVFVAEVLVENVDRELRPGMQGRAKIVGQQRMLFWILFHRAWEKAVSSLR